MVPAPMVEQYLGTWGRPRGGVFSAFRGTPVPEQTGVYWVAFLVQTTSTPLTLKTPDLIGKLLRFKTLGFNRNCYTFVLISLEKIVMGSNFVAEVF